MFDLDLGPSVFLFLTQSQDIFSLKVRKFRVRKRISVHRHTERLLVGGNPKLKVLETLYKHMHVPT